jgi:hypothetical protein
MVNQHCWLIHPSIFGRSWGPFLGRRNWQGKALRSGWRRDEAAVVSEVDEHQQLPLLVDGYSPFRGVLSIKLWRYKWIKHDKTDN